MKSLINHTLILIVLLTGVVSAQAQQRTTRANDAIEIFNDVMRQLDINYVDTLNYESLIETAINEMLRRVDPYTTYYSEKDARQLREMTTGQYGGIGSVIQQREVTNAKGEKEMQSFIVNPYEGMPAQRNGVLAGDRILTINGESTKGKTVSEVSKNLRGLPGSDITLVLERKGEPKPITISFKREEIRRDPVSYYCAYQADSLAAPVGYICLEEFTENSARDFAQALDQLSQEQHIGSLIIDLRGNGGGIIGEAVNIVNLFVDRNTEVVSTRGKKGNSSYSYKTRNSVRYPDMPLIVMVDENSASASEITCGSLQDLKRATLIGQRTFGKGLVQSIRPITQNGSLKVTTAKYYLPSGRCIQAIDYSKRQKGEKLEKDSTGGILPDIVLSDSSKVDITYTLYSNHLFFDYATQYHRTHSTIASPTEFTLTDSDIEDFCHFVEEQKFEYQSETSKYYDKLIELARHEDIDSTSLQALEALKPMLTPNWREAIYRNIEEVKAMLGEEIVLRYYYQKGQLAYRLRYDKELKRALSESDKLYRKAH